MPPGTGRHPSERSADEASSQTYGVVTERDAQLADGAIDVDAEVVGQPQDLRAEVERHDRVPRVVAQDPLQSLAMRSSSSDVDGIRSLSDGAGSNSSAWSTSMPWQITDMR